MPDTCVGSRLWKLCLWIALVIWMSHGASSVAQEGPLSEAMDLSALALLPALSAHTALVLKLKLLAQALAPEFLRRHYLRTSAVVLSMTCSGQMVSPSRAA